MSSLTIITDWLSFTSYRTCPFLLLATIAEKRSRVQNCLLLFFHVRKVNFLWPGVVFALLVQLVQTKFLLDPPIELISQFGIDACVYNDCLCRHILTFVFSWPFIDLYSFCLKTWAEIKSFFLATVLNSCLCLIFFFSIKSSSITWFQR